MAYKDPAHTIAYSRAYKARNRALLRSKGRAAYGLDLEASRTKGRTKSLRYVVQKAAYGKRWRTENPEKHAARQAKRRAAKLLAMPSWLSADQLQQIDNIYAEAQSLSWLSEGGLEVDHIIPLQGKNVRGLHVPWNLQIIPTSQNRKKSNKL